MDSGTSSVAMSEVDKKRRRVPRGEVQRELILDAFERLLGEMSAMEIAVKDITEAAGIKRPNFYFYFESKDDVLAELIDRAWVAWDEAIGSYYRLAGESHSGYFERLFYVSHSVWVRFGRVLVAGIQAVAYDDRLAARWAALDAELYAQLTTQMDRDVEAGLITPATDNHRRLVETLTDMITFAFYKDRRLQCTTAESARMLESLKAIWVGAWGASLHPE